MNKIVLFCVAVLAVLSAARDVPQIPCTFTATVDGQSLMYGKKPNPVSYTIYSLDDKFLAQDGMNGHPFGPMKFILNRTDDAIVRTLTTPVFDDHVACSIVPLAGSGTFCYIIEPWASVEENIKCPLDSHFAYERCDKWSWDDFWGGGHYDFYLLAGTNTPVQQVTSTSIGRDTLSFITFDTTKKPSLDVFAPPEDCSRMFPPSAAKASSSSKFSPVNDMEMISKINAQGLSWKAAPSKAFDGMTKDDFSKMLMPAYKLPTIGQRFHVFSQKDKAVAPKINVKDIPESFEASEEWPSCNIDLSGDQAQCGSCWAFGSTITLGDRFCVADKKHTPLRLSPRYAVDCFENLDGCGGGFGDVAWTDLKELGTVEESCLPYVDQDGNCTTKCDDGSEMKIYKAASAYPLYSKEGSEKTVELIQKEIMTNGPVETSFWVFEDFSSYSSGVYRLTYGGCRGGHAVKIVGWGTDEASGLPYWKIVNSWGTSWGENGSFRIIRGTNECGIEDSVVAGLPQLD